jgi:hypothetical protein
MSRSLIEKLNGKGKVFEGNNFIADVSYDIRVYQHYSETRLLNSTARTDAALNTMTKEQRRKVATRAARARWKKTK